jgi:hypothetical protein
VKLNKDGFSLGEIVVLILAILVVSIIVLGILLFFIYLVVGYN